MPFNGSGVFTRIYSWVADAAANIDISAPRMDQDTDDITSNGLGNCLTRDGQGFATANLPMANFRHTDVGNGVARNDYAALGQVADGIINWAIAGGTADAITVADLPALTALVDGQLCFFRASAANATTTPTFNPNGLGAETITKLGGSSLVAGDIPAANAEVILRYNLANTRWELLNPGTANISPSLLSPTGAVMYTAASSAPSGWLLCNGASVSRTTYAALFAVIGTTYGSVDGSHFTLPDARGRAIFGMDPANGTGRLTGSTSQGISAAALGNSGGEQAHTQLIAEIAQHNHGITDPTHTHTTAAASTSLVAGNTVNGGNGYNTQAASINAASTGITINNAGNGTAFNVVPPGIVLSVIIKT